MGILDSLFGGKQMAGHKPDELIEASRVGDFEKVIYLHKCPVNNRIISLGYRSSHWKYCSLGA